MEQGVWEDREKKILFSGPTVINENMIYSPFHKTLPSSSLKMHWNPVRFYEMGVTQKEMLII